MKGSLEKGWLALPILKISFSYRAKIGAMGQVLAAKEAIFMLLEESRKTFEWQKCHDALLDCVA